MPREAPGKDNPSRRQTKMLANSSGLVSFPKFSLNSLPIRLLILTCALTVFSQPVFAQVSVSVSPSLFTIATRATQQFTATVTGTTNTAVTWQENGVAGGNSTLGLISTTIPETAGENLYLGPSSVPSPASRSLPSHRLTP